MTLWARTKRVLKAIVTFLGDVVEELADADYPRHLPRR